MLPAPTAPSEGYAGQVVQVPGDLFQKSWLTSSGVASHLTTPSEEETDCLLGCASRRLASLSTIGAWQSQSHPMFRGPSWVDHSCVPLCSSTRKLPNRVALEGRSTLPAPLPDWRHKPPKSFALPVGGDRSFRHPPLPSVPCGPSGGGGDFRPDHLLTMHVAAESGKRKICAQACG